MASVIVFSKDRPMQLHAYLESLFLYSDVLPREVTVLLKSTADTNYAKVKQHFAEVNWVDETKFNDDLMSLLNDSQDFIMFGCDDVVFIDKFSIKYAEQILEKDIDIFGFSIRLGTNLRPQPNNAQKENDILIWQWKDCGAIHFDYPWELDATVYRKQDILDMIKKSGGNITSPNYFEGIIAEDANFYIKRSKLSCYNDKNKAIVITVNLVQDICHNDFDDSLSTDIFTLDKLYNQENNTLDIQTIAKKSNSIIHVDSEYFVLRKPVNLQKSQNENKVIKKKDKKGLIKFINNLRYLFRYDLKQMNNFINQKQDHKQKLVLEYRMLKNVCSLKTPKIMGYEECIDYLINNNLSIARFGDGEFALMQNKPIPFQKASLKLAVRLKEIFVSNNTNVLIGIGKIYYDFTLKNMYDFIDRFMENYYAENKEFLYKYINYDKTYIPTEITQLYQIYYKYDFENYFKHIQKIWANKDITIICGENILDNIQHNIFNSAKSRKYIYAPAKDAFSEYEDILKKAKSIEKDRLIIIILGPTATVLAYDLALAGYRALDFGHIAKDYDTYMKKMPRTAESISGFFKPD